MKSKGIIQSVFLFILISFNTIAASSQIKKNELDKFQKTDKNWRLIYNNSNENSGRIIYKNQKWLMYFVHWWELTDENRDISTDYASDLLQNLWRMQFKISNIVGECTVNGHKAYYAEATLQNAVKTRFIVWNCEETNRQFVADCNINLVMNTPEELLELQYNITTSNFYCHNNSQKNNSKLKQLVNYDTLDLSLNIPENWKSKEFLFAKDTSKKIPGYYLNGVTKTQGSIWNLLTDSEKQIDLIWGETKEKLSRATLDEIIYKTESDTIIEMMDKIKCTSLYSNFNFTNIETEKNLISALGSVDKIINIPAYQSIDTIRYKQKIFVWKKQNKYYFILLSMIANDNMWNQLFDLTPSDKIFMEYENSIIKNFKISNLKNDKD